MGSFGKQDIIAYTELFHKTKNDDYRVFLSIKHMYRDV